ncbi:rhomboid family protein [Grosmannia clavigera kw1407]|uniref:Rhomboid family protein n=1 Tax=Grosmannia clavigera (strain kw1407 / UAMH 11150) TaxID=655863 RepID=F0XTW8_GROCL|nr:rhomboid family protein [Grosmannia clavigera kw1407]EFW98841.1 rhomboid family protein [Grosmannia clavigera kw1407]
MPPRLNIPPVTRIALIMLVLQSILSAAIRYRQWTAQSHIVIPYLNLIPQLSVLYPWTFLTTTLVENNMFTLAIAVTTLYQGGRYLERAWSSRELAKFLVVASLIPNLLTFGTLLFFFSLTHDENWTLTTIAGTIPLQISFLVAFSQLVPAHTVTLFRGIVSLRVPRFPLLYVLAIYAVSMTPLLSAASTLLAIFGFLTSWTYLRFYKSVFPDLDSSSQTPSLRGDASETFALAEFFPSPIKPLIAALSNAVFGLLVAVRICTPFSAADISARAAANSGSDGYSHHQRSVPGSNRAEAERRRALALKALDQRLHAAAASAASRGSAAGAGSSAAAASGPSSSAAGASQSAQSLPAATGPTVHTQPKADSQAAMSSQTSSGLLGETRYAPDNASDKSSA